MTTANTHVPATDAARRTSLLPTALRLALRELRSGLGGFYVFVACMALGVGVISAVGALGDALRAGLETQGQAILGGDITLSRIHTRATPEERKFIDGLGRTSETATMRSMARRLDGSDQALIELKGVDRAYPLAGTLALRTDQTLAHALAVPGSAVVDPLLLERLRLKVGDTFRLGNIEARITGVVEKEPDLISDRVSYGSRVLVSNDTLMRTGLVQPGTLVRWRYAALLPAADPASLITLRSRIASALPEAGFLIADRRDPSPRITRTLERLRQFLTLVGITSLLIGGVGVANAVATFIDRRRKVIATMKSIGASGRMVFGIFFTQVMLIAAIGIAIGLGLGYLAPLVVTGLYGSALPVPAVVSVSGVSLATAVAYGALVAVLCTRWPRGRAERIRAGVRFREEVAPVWVWPRWPVIVLILGALAAVVALAILGSDARRTAMWFLAAVAG
ncbi:MAG: ABC transporter permease, partial [Hyphomicrobiaceae bacterium]